MNNAVNTESTVDTQFDSLESHLAAMKDGKARDITAMPEMTQMVQGDVRVVRLPSDWIEKNQSKLKRLENFDGQCAPGNTLGSKHIIENVSTIEAYELSSGNDMDGPIVKFNAPNVLTHPSHGNLTGFKQGDCFAFPGQVVFAEQERRARD